MDIRITQQNREHVARQLGEWLSLRSAPPEQITHMTRSILEGHSDTEILQAMLPQGRRHTVNPQHAPMFSHGPTTAVETPFGFFPIPAMPNLFMPTAPAFFSPPPTMVPNMFPTFGQQQAPSQPQQPVSGPNVQTMRTVLPDGEIVQQTYSGRLGNATVHYSSSSTSRSFSSSDRLAASPQNMLPNQHLQPSNLGADPMQALPQPQTGVQLPHTYTREEPVLPGPSNESQVRIEELNDGVLNPDVEARQPQNARMAETFRNQVQEHTYFSDPPGMPDFPG